MTRKFFFNLLNFPNLIVKNFKQGIDLKVKYLDII